MTTNPAEPKLTLFHSPNTRSTGVVILLDELGADYELHVVNMKAGEQRSAAFLAVNPMGKVPAVLHGDALITEQCAVYLYLADLYPAAGITPMIGDPLRGPFLRWLAFYNSSFEPALIDRSLKREPAPLALCPYGDFDTTMATVNDQLAKGPYLLGERFTAVDVLWGNALNWTTAFGLVPKTPTIAAHIARVTERPACVAAKARDALLAAAQG